MINIQSEKIMRFKTKINEKNNLNLKYLSKNEEEKNDGKNNSNQNNNNKEILRANSYSRFHGKFLGNGDVLNACDTSNYAIRNGSNPKNMFLNNFIRGKNISNINYKNILIKTSDNIGHNEEPMKIDINKYK